MPYTVNTQQAYVVQPALPQHLEHKPVYAIPYRPFDVLSGPNTWARYLSVGYARWNPAEVSAKVIRLDSKGDWAREAEELTLTRPIDLSILIAKVLFDTDANGCVKFRGGTFADQDNGIFVSPEAPKGARTDYDNYVNRSAPQVKGRLNSLCDVLMDLRRRGRI